jgi:isoquinoline 1-oxidoreductase beta subunit
MSTHKAFEKPVSRRQVMIGGAGLSFALALGGRTDAAVIGTEQAGKVLSPWVSIAPDGTITIMSAATEMGQGSMTSLPLIIAEELDADWSKVKIVPAPVNEQIYGNPGFGGMMYTAGSNAVRSYYQNLPNKSTRFFPRVALSGFSRSTVSTVSHQRHHHPCSS